MLGGVRERTLPFFKRKAWYVFSIFLLIPPSLPLPLSLSLSPSIPSSVQYGYQCCSGECGSGSMCVMERQPRATTVEPTDSTATLQDAVAAACHVYVNAGYCHPQSAYRVFVQMNCPGACTTVDGGGNINDDSNGSGGGTETTKPIPRWTSSSSPDPYIDHYSYGGGFVDTEDPLYREVPTTPSDDDTTSASPSNKNPPSPTPAPPSIQVSSACRSYVDAGYCDPSSTFSDYVRMSCPGACPPLATSPPKTTAAPETPEPRYPMTTAEGETTTQPATTSVADDPNVSTACRAYVYNKLCLLHPPYTLVFIFVFGSINPELHFAIQFIY